MTKQEISKALAMAQDDGFRANYNDLVVFDNYGCQNFQKVYVTLSSVASLIRWQCVYFNGGVDLNEFNNLAIIAKTKFQIVG